MSGDICDWLAQEEANAEQWSDYDMGGARFYREQFAAARNEIERLRALVADYENGITWETSCTNCAKLLDDNYDQYCEIERLRAEVERLRADGIILDWHDRKEVSND